MVFLLLAESLSCHDICTVHVCPPRCSKSALESTFAHDRLPPGARCSVRATSMWTKPVASPSSSPFTPPESGLCLPDFGVAPKVRVQINPVVALCRGLDAMDLMRREALVLLEALAHDPVTQVDQVVVAVLVPGCWHPSALNGTPTRNDKRKHTVVAKLDIHLDTINMLRIFPKHVRAAVAIAGDALVLADVVHAKVAGEVVHVAVGDGRVQAKHNVGMLGSCLASAL